MAPRVALVLYWPINWPVSLGHIHLDGCVVLDANGAVAHGAFLRHIQVHELAGVLLVEGSAALWSTGSTERMSVSCVLV